jgi:predicted permease
MRGFQRIRSTLETLFRKKDLGQDLDSELGSYLDLLADEKIRGGMSRDEAYRQAQIELGGVEQVKEQVRDRRLGAHVDVLLQDLRYAGRSLSKNLGFTVVAVAILAIGIGATTALFSNVHSVLVRGVGYPGADRMVILRKSYDGTISGPLSRLDYYDFRDASETLEDIASFTTYGYRAVLSDGPTPELVRVGFATWNLFSLLGERPIAGRGLLLSDEQVGGSTAVLISEGLWKRRFGSSPDAMGSTLRLDGMASTIVGVLPGTFQFMDDADVWRLIDRDGPFDPLRDQHSVLGLGRISSSSTFEQARVEMEGIAARLAEVYPETNEGKSVSLTPLQDYMVRDVRVGLLLLMATTALVLLLACGNVAGLFLARGEQRMSEMAMRSALGASRRRLVRQLLTESVLLTSFAGALGIGIAYLFNGLLLRLIPIGEIGIERPAIHAAALWFAVLLSLGTGLLVGLVPALRTAGKGPARQIGSGSRSSATGRSARLRSGLVVLQVAVSIALLVASGLMIRSLANLSAAELGFDTDHLLTGNIRIQPPDYGTPEETVRFFIDVKDEIASQPGVLSAALISKLPIISPWTDWGIWPAEAPPPSARDMDYAMARYVSPGYFETMGIPLIAGRDIVPSDRIGTEDVVVISESTARTLFGDEEAVDRLVGIGWTERSFRVVGIVGDAKLNLVRDDANRAMYMAMAQNGASFMYLAVRTTDDPESVSGQIADIVRNRDPNALFADAASMESVLSRDRAGFRTVIMSLALFAGLAMTLTAIGLYGVLAYHVGTRRREFGIRRAVGATDGVVLGMVLGRGLSLVGMGLLAGLTAAYPGTLLVRQLLFETPAIDPLSYAGAVGFLVLVAAGACLIPALRATRTEIMQVLRTE